MKNYKVKVQISFEGKVFVKAKNKKEAQNIVKHNFSAVGPTYSDNLHEQIENWDMSCHSDSTDVTHYAEILMPEE